MKKAATTRKHRIDMAKTMSDEQFRAACAGEMALEAMREALGRAAKVLADYEAKYRDSSALSHKATILSWVRVTISRELSSAGHLIADAQQRMHVLLPDE